MYKPVSLRYSFGTLIDFWILGFMDAVLDLLRIGSSEDLRIARGYLRLAMLVLASCNGYLAIVGLAIVGLASCVGVCVLQRYLHTVTCHSLHSIHKT